MKKQSSIEKYILKQNAQKRKAQKVNERKLSPVEQALLGYQRQGKQIVQLNKRVSELEAQKQEE